MSRGRLDGSSHSGSALGPTGPGYWEPTPPAFAPPIEPLAGTWRSWNLDRASQFRPPPPPAYGSDRFKAEAQAVYDVSQSLTDAQRRIASLWADGPGTATPPGHWNLIALRLLRAKRVGTGRAALILAALNTAQADAFVACWDAKFAYWSVRPVTILRRAFDPGWTPFLPTPPFPSYVSGHATTSGAASKVLAHFFPSAARQLDEWAGEAALSRLYGGIHFRIDNDVGLSLGHRVAGAAIDRLGRGSN